MHRAIKLGISTGDINGIGPEVILKCFSSADIYKQCTPIVFGHYEILAQHAEVLKMPFPKHRLIQNPEDAQTSCLNILEPEHTDLPELAIGELTEAGGAYAFQSLASCTQACIKEALDAMLTAPINKANIQSEHFQFPGHTEYLANAVGKEESLMLLVYENFRLAMLTGHVPLREVALQVHPQNIEKKIKLLASTLVQDFGIAAPRIAVLSLNPHAGDKGVLGSEENDSIHPAIESLRREGILCEGSFAADGFFGAKKHKEFDAIFAMYHDQGLIAFKALSFDKGVNFTGALPIIRTSPDHGTAFDIAGKNLASEESFRRAALLAAGVFRQRLSHKP
jgi:4-hydroxythreonine-4-phosphate dehydrogenase